MAKKTVEPITCFELNDGWDTLRSKGINKLIKYVDDAGDARSPFLPEEFLEIYTVCYNMCTHKNAPGIFSQVLYERFGKAFDDYLKNTVLKSLQEVDDHDILAEFAHRWRNHKLMYKWMSRVFMFLDRWHVKQKSLPPLEEAAHQSFERVVIKNIENDRIKRAMLELIRGDTSNAAEGNTSILSIHDKFRSIMNEYQGNPFLRPALEGAFHEFVNNDVGPNTCARLLSTFFCDCILETDDEQVEEHLEKGVLILSYLTAKHLFEEIYRDQLAKRLLNQNLVSANEEVLIRKLKLQCGAQFTAKMETMMNDLNPQIPILRQENNPMEFSVQVLTTGCWPSYNVLEINMPSHMADCMNQFQQYYDSKTSERRLQWIHSLGNATIHYKISDEKWYDFQVTTLQAVTLLQFNNVEGIASVDSLCGSLNLSKDVVKRILHSLCESNILNKKPDGNVFEVNNKFIYREQIQKPSLDESLGQKKNVDEDRSLVKKKNVNEDRSLAIGAAIIRIMKAQKKLQHHQLVSKVKEELACFQPQIKVIKSRIEALIDREYLKRDAEDNNIYHYLV